MENQNLALTLQNPRNEYLLFLHTLKQEFKEEMVSEIEAFVNLRTNIKFNKIENLFSTRYNNLYALYTRMEEIKTKQEQNQCLKEFFELVNPKELLKDLKQAFEFNDIEKEYKLFIEKMSLGTYGQIFQRYQWNEKVYRFLENVLLYQSEEVLSTLKIHANQLSQHFNLMRQLKEGAATKGIIKLGARLLGSAIAGPLGSFAVRGITNALMNDQEKIASSLQEVEDKWNDFIAKQICFLNEVQERYKYVLLTLYGGTLLQANKDFNSFHLRISDVYLHSFSYKLDLTNDEKTRVQKWSNESIKGIINLFENKSFSQAIIASTRLYEFVSKNSIMSCTIFNNGNSLLFTVNLYKMAALHFKAKELLLQSEHKFIKFMCKVYQNNKLIISDSALSKIGAPTLGELTIHFIHLGIMKDIQLSDYPLDYLENTIVRFLQNGYYIGEKDAISEDVYGIFSLLANFIQDNHQKQHPLCKRAETLPPPHTVKTLRKEYKTLVEKDVFFTYLSSYMIGSYIRKIMGIIFNKKVFITLICSFLIFVGGYWGWKEISFLAQKQVSQTLYLVPKVAVANIRKEPNLNTEIISTINNNEEVQYLQEQQTDKRRVIWYKVKTKEGNEGWISSIIVNWRDKNDKVIKYFTIQAQKINIRVAPNTDAKILATKEKNQTLIYLNNQKKNHLGEVWYEVKLEDGSTGWVFNELVK